ncbi:MAG: GxxExxY protein [Desulfuromonadaceae bacterium]|nr:GxxExxY protein [Desulfuromonadaceae bacterium]MDD2848547.1 GxxExxY protein [Desulfuromonadaceae bacterium]MDD4131551.1 GxxExxY protein [Desulfuromonadaceae bacterium]
MPDDAFAELLYKDTSFQIIAAVYEVHNVLGYGFLEAVYQKALEKELRLRDLKAEVQKEITVTYKNEDIGSYYADIIVNDEIILELKAVENLTKAHESQLLNYLKGTGLKLGFLINFGKEKAIYKRMVL